MWGREPVNDRNYISMEWRVKRFLIDTGVLFELNDLAGVAI